MAELASETSQENPLSLPELPLGVVVDTGVASVKVAPPSQEAGASLDCQVGDYLVISAESFLIFSQVSNVRLETIPGSDGARGPVASVTLLNTINPETGAVTPGVSSTPRIGASTYATTTELVQFVAESKAKKGGSAPDVTLDLAVLADGHDTPVMVTPEMLFSRHMAIVGTTGAGKSYTLARLVEEIGKHQSKLILFDASGEFGALDTNTFHVYLGEHPEPPSNFYQVSVPYYELTENDLFAIVKPSGEGQAPKLRAAINTLKLLKLAPSLGLNGNMMKANREKKIFENYSKQFRKELENPAADFDISKLVAQINLECVHPYRSAVEAGFWGDIDSLAVSQCSSLATKVADITNSPNLAPIFQSEDIPSLFAVIDSFLREDKYSVLCISLQYLSFEHNAREIVANAAGRYLMELARAEKFQDRPVLVTIDEAHQFLNEQIENMSGDYPLDSFALIAKEGRKYALHICLATQRPRDIPESVLSQMGSLIVHRLINDKDRQIIERASGEADESTMQALPSFTQGQAVLLGAEFPVPLKVQIRFPTNPPLSRSADFQKHWKREDKVKEALEDLVTAAEMAHVQPSPPTTS